MTKAKSSALVDTRVIYCGDNLEQLKKLPDACVDLIYWSWWYNRWEPWETDSAARELNKKFFEAYGLSLAIDLKRVVGERYHVEFRGERIEVPNPKDLHEVFDHLSPDTQPKDASWMNEFPIPKAEGT